MTVKSLKLRKLELLQEKKKRQHYNQIKKYYPDTGPLRRELYKKHMAFFDAGSKHPERLFMAANRIGKTEGAGGYETTLHLTGDYPVWWTGKRFDRPVDWWAAGDTTETVRDILQKKLLGDIDDLGSGLIPRDKIKSISKRRGVSDTVDTIIVHHKSGGLSRLSFKSYDQKRKSFQGTKKDGIWLDEEPPLEIYTECLLRTMDTSGEDDEEQGIMLLTFTPLLGMSETVMAFLPGGSIEERSEGSKFVIMATWDDVPHLSEKAKKTLWESIPPFQRDARSKGIPQLGAGAIFPVPESDFVVDPFEIPDHWPRAYGLDVGWNRTAGAFAAWDRDNDCVYLFSEHYRGQAEPSIHAESIKARGEWIPGVIDPAARGRNQKDGIKLMDDYVDLGLDLDTAFNGVESGLHEMWQRLSTGRLKVFKNMSNWLFEFRLYRRDEKGRVVKSNDHIMDATRYLIMSGLDRAITKPIDAPKQEVRLVYDTSNGTGWMG
jgi:phage terminase large subunit-like protein